MSSLKQIDEAFHDPVGIPVEHEDASVVNDYGVGELMEHCFFCNHGTRYWHLPTNNPCCRTCAKKHAVSEFNTAPEVN